jgi:hypothetical protein
VKRSATSHPATQPVLMKALAFRAGPSGGSGLGPAIPGSTARSRISDCENPADG